MEHLKCWYAYSNGFERGSSHYNNKGLRKEPLPETIDGIDFLIVMVSSISRWDRENFPYYGPKAELSFYESKGCRADSYIVGVCLVRLSSVAYKSAKYEHSPEREIGVSSCDIDTWRLVDPHVSLFGASFWFCHWHGDTGLTENAVVLGDESRLSIVKLFALVLSIMPFKLIWIWSMVILLIAADGEEVLEDQKSKIDLCPKSLKSFELLIIKNGECKSLYKFLDSLVNE